MMGIVPIEKSYIAGGSGLVGSALIQELLLDSNVKQIIALGRRSLGLKNEKILEQITNFKDLSSNPLDFDEAAMIPDDIPVIRDEIPVIRDEIPVRYCCLGSTIKKAGSQKAFFEIDHDFIMHFAKFCKKQGVKHFILVSSMGANSESAIFYNKVKGMTENDLQNLKFKKLSILRPSILIGKRKESRPLESIGQALGKIISPLFIGPLQNFCPIKATLVARKMKELSHHYLSSEQAQNESSTEVISNRDIF